jgi:hypothetical protein
MMRMAVTVVTVLVLAGCAGTERQPQCRGPWVPVNAPAAGQAHG